MLIIHERIKSTVCTNMAKMHTENINTNADSRLYKVRGCIAAVMFSFN